MILLEKQATTQCSPPAVHTPASTSATTPVPEPATSETTITLISTASTSPPDSESLCSHKHPAQKVARSIRRILCWLLAAPFAIFAILIFAESYPRFLHYTQVIWGVGGVEIIYNVAILVLLIIAHKRKQKWHDPPGIFTHTSKLPTIVAGCGVLLLWMFAAALISINLYLTGNQNSNRFGDRFEAIGVPLFAGTLSIVLIIVALHLFLCYRMLSERKVLQKVYATTRDKSDTSIE